MAPWGTSYGGMSSLTVPSCSLIDALVPVRRMPTFGSADEASHSSLRRQSMNDRFEGALLTYEYRPAQCSVKLAYDHECWPKDDHHPDAGSRHIRILRPRSRSFLSVERGAYGDHQARRVASTRRRWCRIRSSRVFVPPLRLPGQAE